MKILFIFLILSQNLLAASKNEKSKKAFKPLAIPTVSANRSKGLGAGVLAMGFFTLGKDKKTPPSRVGFAGNLTTKDNYTTVLFQQIFFTKDEWRLNSAQIIANSNFQTFVSSPDLGTVEIPYNNYFRLFFLNVQKRVVSKIYLGPSIGIGSADTRFDLEQDKTQTQQLNSLGLFATFDTTKNKYNANQGQVIKLRWNEYPEWFGNKQAFGSFNLNANFYHQIDEKKVLASRASAYYAYGDVPFVGERFVGNKDIRGYTQGEYRGDQIYGLQTEYRWNFYKRWGSVMFAGLAMAKDQDEWSELLPGGGAGMRYKLLEKEGINAGLDYAVGKADWGVYFRITEAF